MKNLIDSRKRWMTDGGTTAILEHADGFSNTQSSPST